MSAYTVCALTVMWTLGWVVGWAKRPAEGRAHRVHGTARSISVIVPARNEAQRLGTLFTALDTTGLEIIVVDDDSADDTAAVARAAGARVVSVVAEAGWTGKAWACWNGAQAARGDVLVFVDADTHPTPRAVGALAHLAAASGGLASVQPMHRTARAYEQLSALPNLVAVMGAGSGVLRERSWWRAPAAFGMAMAVPREAYLRAGGHRARRAAIADDLALAETMSAAGFPVGAWCGGVDMSVRMYGEGPAQLARGWIKNLSAGARSIPPLRTAAVALWITGLTRACVGLIDVVSGGGAERWIALSVYAAFTVQVAVLAGRVGTFVRGVVVALPVLVGAFLAFFAASIIGTLVRRDVSWRGRDVRIGALP